MQIIDLQNNNLVGGLGSWNISSFPNLEDLYFGGNASLTGNIGSWVLPSPLENLQVHNTSLSGDIGGWTFPSALIALKLNGSGVSGDIGDWTLPNGLQTFTINNTALSGDVGGWVLPSGGTGLLSFQINNTSLTGDISSWVIPATTQYFYAGATSLSGVPVLTSMIAIREIQVYSCSLNQANVNAWLQAIYNRWASLTYATPSLLIHGTNAAPSGTYQDADPPTTGKEYAYELENDPEATGNHTWAITFTA